MAAKDAFPNINTKDRTEHFIELQISFNSEKLFPELKYFLSRVMFVIPNNNNEHYEDLNIVPTLIKLREIEAKYNEIYVDNVNYKYHPIYYSRKKF